MKNSLTYILFGLLAGCMISLAAGHKPIAPLACISVETNPDYLFQRMDNDVTIVAQQKRPVSLDQIRVTGGKISGDEGQFWIHPDTSKIVNITVATRNGTWSKSLRTKPIIPVARLGGKFTGNVQMGNGELKAQGGIMANVECCGFSARCDIVSFTVFRITKDNQLFRAENKGDRFGDAVLQLTQAARPGDLFWFHNIQARCPGEETAQPLEDISVDVR